MESETFVPKRYIGFAFGGLVLSALYLTSLYSYLLFHSLAELSSIIVAFTIFILAWNTRRLQESDYLLFIGIGFLFVGIIDLGHTLAYKGLGVFPGGGTNLAAQLWIAARYLQSLTLLAAPLFLRRKIRFDVTMLGFGIVTALLLASIFYWQIFPVCFMEGAGLTPFKIISEYIISAILVGSAVFLLSRRREFDRRVLNLLLASIALTISSELAFTLYTDPYGLLNLIGHLLKIAAFYLVYKALVETGLVKPFELLFRSLKQSEEELRKNRNQLERLVAERTAELKTTNASLVREIAERKVAEAALRLSEERYCTALDSLMEGCQIIGFDWRYLYINDAAARQGQRIKEELLGHTMMEMYPGIENTEMFANLRNCVEKRLPHHMENLFTFPDGSQGWFELSISPVPEGIFILSLDTTERKQAEEELNLKAQLLDEATDLIHVTDLNWRILYVNEASCLSLGYSKDELLGHDLREFLAREVARRAPPANRDVEGNNAIIEAVHIRKDKTLLPVEVHSRIVSWGDRKVRLDVVRDVTERKKAEEALRESEERYRTLVLLGAEAGEAIVMLQDTEQGEGVQTFVSDPWLQITGYSREELLGKPFFDLLSPKDRAASIERHRRKLSGKAMPGLYEMTIITKDQAEVPIELTSTYTIYNGRKANVAYIRDITERKKMHEQLMLTDRLASIGQLASGIAHELNNPLTGVIGFSELLLEKNLPDDIREDLTTINKEARRTASVVKGLLTFARKQRTEKEAVDINSLIQAVLQLRSYEQRVSNIEVETRFAADLPEIMGNGAQLQQVFMNIIVNAEQAMLEAHGRGALTITTERTGDTEKISFADDGPGIARENMRRLFTPFFTTKEAGKGTGLGLSICHGIIAEHGGRIYAESEPGKGATFIIELPITKQC